MDRDQVAMYVGPEPPVGSHILTLYDGHCTQYLGVEWIDVSGAV